MSPVGFYKKGGKTRPITKAKPKKTRVIKRARIAQVNRGGYDHDGTWIPDANDVIIECAGGTAHGVVSVLPPGCYLYYFEATPRGRGIGPQAWALVEKYLKAEGCSRVDLCSSNERSMKFWRRMGFKQLNEDMWEKQLKRKRRPEQDRFLKNRLEEHLKSNPAFAELNKKLLSLGGDLVVPMPERDQEAILSRGELWDAGKVEVELIKGKLSQCHENSSILWRHNEKYKIVTGWGLSEDGLWRQHTWIVVDGKVIETTVPRLKYFGFELTRPEAFYFDNVI